MGQYFSKFPLTAYDNQICKNIFVRLKIAEALDENNNALLPYTVKDGERPDTVAYTYYGDSYLSWLIYIVNSIYDPFFDWPLDGSTLEQFIIEKYGSIELAKRKVLHYRLEWAGDDTTLTPTQYTELDDNLKKYYAPFLGFNNQVVFYERKKIDLISLTNKTVELTVNTASGYELGEKASQGSLAFGDIIFINTNDNIVTIQNVEGSNGTFTANTSLVGDNSGFTSTVNNVNIISIAIDPTESQFWSQVNAYDFEWEENEEKRNIVLLDKSFASGMAQIISNLLGG